MTGQNSNEVCVREISESEMEVTSRAWLPKTRDGHPGDVLAHYRWSRGKTKFQMP